MNDKKKREAVERAIELTHQAKKSGEVAAKGMREVAEALEDPAHLMAKLEQFKEENKQRKARGEGINRPVMTGPLPDVNACMEAAKKARKEAGKQQLLAKRAEERANNFENLVRVAWTMAHKDTKASAEAWIEAADAWEVAAIQLS